ncbi:MAG: hypothetical protein KC503_06965 [Myxococcales bacterium]|nr:hypothetical protein [Myxococcales bacterium]
MRWVGFIIMMAVFVCGTGGALLASAGGWGLPGELDEPISIRQGSSGPYGRRGGVFIYFGARRHYGGGYGHGK